MRKLAIIFMAFLAGCAFACAGEKVVDSSGKQPKWVFATAPDYIIVSAESADIEEAKEKAMTKVKKQILASIAENVRSTSSINTTEHGVNGKYDIIEDYESVVETESALIPFLSEVGINKAEAYYWEKIKKDKNSYTYRYHLKYPFSKFDLMRMLDDFLERESKIDQQIEEFSNDDFTSYNSVEQMVAQQNKLRTFRTSLMERDPRRNTCSNIDKIYSNYIRSITLRLVSVNKSELVYAPYFGEKKLTTNVQPKLSSNCLGDLQYVARDGQCTVTYDFQTACYDDEENYLEVVLPLPGNKLKNRFIVK